MRGKVKKRARTREAATQATHSACDNDDNDRQTTQETIARRSVGAIRHKSLLLLLQLLLLLLLTLLLLLHLLSSTIITTTVFHPLCYLYSGALQPERRDWLYIYWLYPLLQAWFLLRI